MIFIPPTEGSALHMKLLGAEDVQQPGEHIALHHHALLPRLGLVHAHHRAGERVAPQLDDLVLGLHALARIRSSRALASFTPSPQPCSQASRSGSTRPLCRAVATAPR